MEFKDLSLHPHIISGITKAGFINPTPIQAKAIPTALNGVDVLGVAQTGTGKTAAFAIPALQKILAAQNQTLSVLVLVPTRELADQVEEGIALLGRKARIRTMTVYGGVSMHNQIARLRNGVQLVVACPGRLNDHIKRGSIDLSRVETLVIDEADRMFDMGFLPEVRKISAVLPAKRQTLFFSATMPGQVRELADELLKDAETISVSDGAMADTVSHALYKVGQSQKTALLISMLGSVEAESVLVFTRTKHRAQKLAERLGREGHKAVSLQGNLSQNKRKAALSGFKNGEFSVMVATDIAARGIDVATVSHVINYDMPNTIEDYTHRTGRTGRACRTGNAFSLVTSEDRSLARAIEKSLPGRLEWRAHECVVDAEAETESEERPERRGFNDKRRFIMNRKNSRGQDGRAGRNFGNPHKARRAAA